MAQANIVVIPDRYTARGITFLAHGQQCTTGLPAGEYDYICDTEVCYTDLGKPARTKAAMLVNIATAEKWYVSLNVAEFLLRDHKRPLPCHAD